MNSVSPRTTRLNAAEEALESSLCILKTILKEYGEELGMTSQGESGAARDLEMYRRVQELNILLAQHAKTKN